VGMAGTPRGARARPRWAFLLPCTFHATVDQPAQGNFAQIGERAVLVMWGGTQARSRFSLVLGVVEAPGRGFEPRLTDPEPGIRGGEMPTLMVSDFVPLALRQLSRLSSLFGKLLQARHNEM
jgi:hypothetical protein